MVGAPPSLPLSLPNAIRLPVSVTPPMRTEAKPLTAVEVTSYLLGALRENEAIVKAAEREVVITLPTSFTDRQGVAIVESARRAGFDAVDFIDEAYAAALAYRGDATEEQTFVVYDLGAKRPALSARIDGKLENKQNVMTGLVGLLVSASTNFERPEPPGLEIVVREAFDRLVDTLPGS